MKLLVTFEAWSVFFIILTCITFCFCHGKFRWCIHVVACLFFSVISFICQSNNNNKQKCKLNSNNMENIGQVWNNFKQRISSPSEHELLVNDNISRYSDEKIMVSWDFECTAWSVRLGFDILCTMESVFAILFMLQNKMSSSALYVGDTKKKYRLLEDYQIDYQGFFLTF